MMTRKVQLYELAAKDDKQVFSPYCWRIRFACLHKGLQVETIPWRFIEKEKLEFANSKQVPVLVDGNRAINESFEIAKYLEKTYPDAPSLFGGEGGEAGCFFINSFADSVMMHFFPLIVADVWSTLDKESQDYFRTSREKMFGKKLEDCQKGREEEVKTFQESLEPARQVLQKQPFLGGQKPTYSDYVLVSILLTAKATTAFPIIARDDTIYAWRERVLDLYDGQARTSMLHDA